MLLNIYLEFTTKSSLIHIKVKQQFFLLLKNSKNVSYMTFNTHPTIYKEQHFYIAH